MLVQPAEFSDPDRMAGCVAKQQLVSALHSHLNKQMQCRAKQYSDRQR